MTTNLTFPTPAQLQDFEAKCRAAFPALNWQMEGSDRNVYAQCRANIPQTSLEIVVEYYFNFSSAASTVSLKATEGSSVGLFRSTWFKDQSLEEAIALLRDFLQGYAAALDKALEGGDRHE